jgi:hypothetical protein
MFDPLLFVLTGLRLPGRLSAATLRCFFADPLANLLAAVRSHMLGSHYLATDEQNRGRDLTSNAGGGDSSSRNKNKQTSANDGY